MAWGLRLLHRLGKGKQEGVVQLFHLVGIIYLPVRGTVNSLC
jgi:hypothetical protein